MRFGGSVLRLVFISLSLTAVIACNIYIPPGLSDGTTSPEGAAPGQGGAGGGTGGTIGVAGDAGGTNDASGGTNDIADASGSADGDAGILREDVPIVTAGLPFAVDTYFVATGNMGDAVRRGFVVVDTTNCQLPRPSGAHGNCYKISYKPFPPAIAGDPAWAGIYWLAPRGNWGTSPGQKVEPAATMVTFYAAGTTGTESVSFRAGGIQDPASPYRDTFRIERIQTLTTTLTKYSLDLTAQTYSEVIGGFAWVITTFDAASWAPNAPPIVFYLDDIVWTK
jgi:hypothetical protein